MRNKISICIIAICFLFFSCGDDDKKVVVCWGDSLTSSHVSGSIRGKIKKLIIGDNSYPSVLEETLGKGYDIVNCGVRSEGTLTIMGRQGAFPIKLAHDIILDNRNKTKFTKFIGNSGAIPFESTYNGQKVTPLLQGGWSENGSSYFNPCIINGKSYTIKSETHFYREDEKFKFEFNYFIENNQKTSKTDTLKKGTIIETNGMHTLRNVYANVFFMGQNGGFKDASELIEQYKAMIKYSNCTKYIIIGYHKPNDPMPNINRMIEMEDSLSQAFENHYINLRSYLVKDGLKDANLTQTPIDTDSIMHNQVPPQLMTDGIHLTSVGYALVGKLVAKRFKELGY